MSETCPICGAPVSAQESACSTCGFKLLGSTQSFSPIVTEQAAADVQPAVPKPRSASLRVVRGPRPEVVFSLGDEPMTIGRNPQCDIFLNDMTVSRAHATIEPSAEGYVVRDHNSFNGLWVNNRFVEEATLRPGDMLQVGAFCLVYEEE